MPGPELIRRSKFVRVPVVAGYNRFDANAAVTTTLTEAGSGVITGANGGRAAIWLDPARTPSLEVEHICLVNSTAPTCDIGVAVIAVSAPTGAAATVSLTQGSTVSGSTVNFTTPAANSTNRSTAIFACPAAGLYVLAAIIGTGGMVANSSVSVRAWLRHV